MDNFHPGDLVRLLLMIGGLTMRRLSCAVFAFIAFTSAASAAPPSPMWNWTGFYLGGNVGYGWGTSPSSLAFSDTTGPLITQSASLHIDGVIGGGQAGYNWQMGNWVFGLEADIQGSGQKGDVTLICPAGVCSASAVTTTLTEKLKWFGTVRPRLGWTITPTILAYATGGLAYGELTESGTIANAVVSTPFSFSKTSTGWTVGGGFEGQLYGNWTWKIEYLYLQLEEPTGNVATTIIGPGGRGGGTPVTVEIDPIFKDNIVRAGINYKFF
jgi:outer membrane immunogenic protein